MTALLQRDRRILFAALSFIAISAWAYMAYEARVMYRTGSCCCAGMKMSGPDTSAWSPTTLLPLFLMWAEMMVAMMLPTAMPAILCFAAIQRKRHTQNQPYVFAGFFTAGYLLVWTAFSFFAAIAQWMLHGTALLSPMMASNNAILSGVILISAGVFQFTRMKNSCLARCQSSANSAANPARESKSGALLTGLKHGLHCTGCCWFLMLLLFVAGVMNLGWIAILTVFVLLEKVLPNARRLTQLSGFVLLLWGVCVLVF